MAVILCPKNENSEFVLILKKTEHLFLFFGLNTVNSGLIFLTFTGHFFGRYVLPKFHAIKKKFEKKFYQTVLKVTQSMNCGSKILNAHIKI